MTVPETVDSFRVGNVTLGPGDEVPPEFEALIPDAWKQTPAPNPKPTATAPANKDS